MTKSSLQQAKATKSTSAAARSLSPGTPQPQGVKPQEIEALFRETRNSSQRITDLLSRQNHMEVVLTGVIVILLATLGVWLLTSFEERRHSYDELLKQFYAQNNQINEIKDTTDIYEIQMLQLRDELCFYNSSSTFCTAKLPFPNL